MVITKHTSFALHDSGQASFAVHNSPQERPPVASTQPMRDRLRELSTPPQDDFDHALLIALDDLDRIVRHYRL